MHEHGKSDRPVIPAKQPNKAVSPGAQAVGGRGLAKGNAGGPTRPGPRAGLGELSGLDCVREVARKDKDARFTALLHHVSVERLRAAYGAISPQAAPGVDGVTWGAYGGPGGQPPGPAPAGPKWCLPGEAVSQGLHPQG